MAPTRSCEQRAVVVLDRLLGVCLSILAGAVAIYVAARLIESIAATLVLIVAAIGGLLIVGCVVRLLWSRHRANRW